MIAYGVSGFSSFTKRLYRFVFSQTSGTAPWTLAHAATTCDIRSASINDAERTLDMICSCSIMHGPSATFTCKRCQSLSPEPARFLAALGSWPGLIAQDTFKQIEGRHKQ